MDEITAQQIVTAHAACAIVDGCGLCPLYSKELNIKTQQALCQNSITADKVREALTTLRGNIEHPQKLCYNGNEDKTRDAARCRE